MNIINCLSVKNVINILVKDIELYFDNYACFRKLYHLESVPKKVKKIVNERLNHAILSTQFISHFS